MRDRALPFLLLVVTVGCTPSVPASDGSKPPSDAPIERVSRTQINVSSTAKVDMIMDEKGGPRGFSTARDDGGVTYIVCGCQPGCGSSSCKLKREDTTGSSRFWCTGSCSTSEGGECGGCVFVESDKPPTPTGANGSVGVDVNGGQQPGVDATPEK